MYHILYRTDFHSKRGIRARCLLVGIIGKGCGLESKRVSFFTDEFKIARYHIGSLPLPKMFCIALVMNSTEVQNPQHKMQVALLAERKTPLEYYEH